MSDPSAPAGTDSPDDDSLRAIEGVVNDLYGLMRQDIPFEDKARQALEFGRDYLDADNGHLTRIDTETDHWEAVVSTDPPDGEFPPGLELDLQTTYCRNVVEADSQVAFNDAPNQGFADDPAYETHGVHCYVGTPLQINGEQYGTVCFVATDPRSEPYSEGEKMLAELIAHMLERELERDQFETQLLRQTNLSLVLNRVLRHNLRNEMAVIRGYTQLMAEKLSDSSFGRRALRSIDKVINLSEKARELDEIIASDEERGQRNVRVLIEEVISTVRSEYPAASISIDGDEKVPAAVLPSFKRAIRELIENAAKHGGDQPAVEVTVELIPDAIEIRIGDNGPGLDQQEIDVLRSGAETPLTHGSGLGLWLTHWIISSHDGSIEPSVTDGGTTITLTFPRTPVTDAEQPMHKLLRARDQYKAAFDEAGDGMTITDDKARILDVNDEAASLYGMDKQALIGRSIREFLPDDFDFEAEWGEIQASDRRRDELQVVSADGGVSTIEYTAKTHIVPGQHLIVGRDITERIEREQERSSLKEKFETLFDAAPDPIFLADDETGEIIDVNTSAESLLGESRDQVIGRHQTSLHPAEDAELYEEAFKNVSDTEEVLKQLPDGSQPKVVTNDGETVPIEISVATVSLPSGPVKLGILRDVTKQLERERELQQERNRFRAVFEEAFDAMVIADDDGQYRNVNASAAELFELSKEELVGRNIDEFAPGEFDFEEAWRDFHGSGQERGTFPLVTNNGNERLVEYAASPNITPGEHLSVLRDITERKNRERELIQYEAAFKKAGDGMTITDDEARIQDVNEAASRLYGEDKEELIGRSMKEFLPDDFDFETEWGEIQAAKMKRNEMKIVSADGGVNPIEYTAKTDIVPGQHLIVSRKIDSSKITEQQKREKRLRRQNERLNEFASVVSHDLRNPLNVAKGRIGIAQEEYDSEDLDTAARSIDRSFDLIEDMLTLARDGLQVNEMQPVEVDTLVETCWDNFETANATVVVDLDRTIQADRSRLRQLLENLFRNAVEHGGNDVTVRVGELADGFYVEDDGPGIPEDERESVFEPGYSNSPDGTGFGLPIVKRIANAHGWQIQVTEGPDGGARFEITDIEIVAE